MDKDVKMGNTHIHNTNKKVKELGCTDALVALPDFLDDDRVRCNHCRHCDTREADEFVDLDRAKQMRAMGKRVGMSGDKFEVKGKWLRVSWTEPYCHATGFAPIPGQQLHRCHLFEPKPASVKSDEWWLT